MRTDGLPAAAPPGQTPPASGCHREHAYESSEQAMVLAGPPLRTALCRAGIEHTVRAEVVAFPSVRRMPQVRRLVRIARLAGLLGSSRLGAMALAASVPMVLPPTQYSRRRG